MPPSSRPSLEVRTATPRDIPGIVALSKRVYRDVPPYTRGQINGQISAFPRGTFVVCLDGEIVGYAASTITQEERIMRAHSWAEITGGGYSSHHNARGDWLYGLEVMVDPERRRLRIGHRLYQARERLCIDLDLKGIAFGGRMPGYRRVKSRYPDPADYIAAVRSGEQRDTVMAFQLKAGFEPLHVLYDYDPEDRASGGHAALMVWRNPYHDDVADAQPITRPDPEIVRVASVQLEARSLQTPEEFYRSVDYFVNVAAGYGADFVLFPEYFTLQLLSCEQEVLPPEHAITRATEHTAEFTARLSDMALSRAINVVAGSHATRVEDGDIHNISYVFLRDGSVHTQEKLHPTPDERSHWNIMGGDTVDVINTDCGPIGVLVCYDAEFPEAARRLADEGARILFVPYNTDTRNGHLRVRYCSQARAIENQVYVVTAGMAGNLDKVSNLDIQYAQSAILTPCDVPFARDGIAAEASENIEMIIIADLNIGTLLWSRAQGAVRPLRDRRLDLYRTRWSDGG